LRNASPERPRSGAGATIVDLGEIELDEPARPHPPVRRPPGTPRRPRWPLAAVAAAIAVTAAVASGGNDDEDPSTSPPTTDSAQSSPRPDVVVFSPRGLDETLLIGAPVGYEATGSLATIDVAQHTVRQRVHDVRLWPGDFEVPMLTVGDHLVWADLEHAWSVPVDLHRDPVVIGDASYIVPARDREHVWLVQQNPMRVTEVGADGDVRRATFALPANTRPIAGVDLGLLVSANRGTALLDDSTGEVVRMFWNRGIFAASGTTALTRGLALLDLTTGESRQLEGSDVGRYEPADAVFSPDGAAVAILTGPAGTRQAGIEVHRVDDGTLDAFHRIQSGTIVWNSVVWSPQSDALYFLSSDTGGSADRIIGIPERGSAQTVAVLDEQGWYWLAVS
jgi:sugar lactone lactonase YvrE